MRARTLSVIPAATGKATAQARRVVLYARVSSKEQREEGYSIEAQLRLLRDYAVKQGFLIAQEFIDVESASKSGRTGFNEMLAYLSVGALAAAQSSSRKLIACIGT